MIQLYLFVYLFPTIFKLLLKQVLRCFPNISGKIHFFSFLRSMNLSTSTWNLCAPNCEFLSGSLRPAGTPPPHDWSRWSNPVASPVWWLNPFSRQTFSSLQTNLGTGCRFSGETNQTKRSEDWKRLWGVKQEMSTK